MKGVDTKAAFSHLGIDSMMSIEIQQTLEREFQLFLTTAEIQSLSFDKLSKMSGDLDKNSHKLKSRDNKNVLLMNLIKNIVGKNIIPETCVKLSEKGVGKNEVFLIPGVEGVSTVFSTISLKLTVPATCLQLKSTEKFNQSIFEMAEDLLPVN